MATYLLDANVLIEAKNGYYGFDFCPAFWDWLVEQNGVGKVASIEKVASELRRRDDELTARAAEWGDRFFLALDEAVYTRLDTVIDWANRQGYEERAVKTFLDGADSHLVAYALVHDRVVVTHERAAHTYKKIKIPNVCRAFRVNCINTYAMLRQEEARFVLERAGKAA